MVARLYGLRPARDDSRSSSCLRFGWRAVWRGSAYLLGAPFPASTSPRFALERFCNSAFEVRSSERLCEKLIRCLHPLWHPGLCFDITKVPGRRVSLTRKVDSGAFRDLRFHVSSARRMFPVLPDLHSWRSSRPIPLSLAPSAARRNCVFPSAAWSSRPIPLHLLLHTSSA